MIRIGICDDNELNNLQIEKYVIRYLKNNNIDAEIEYFVKADEVISYMKEEGEFDILFLDIKLGVITGIDVGIKIRKEFCNDYIQIIYVSWYSNYAMQLFKLHPLDFIVKPINYQKIENVMNEYNRLFKFKNSYFEYSIRKKIYHINEQSIIYFQSIGKKINMVTKMGVKEFYGKLSEIYKTLNTNSFCMIHKSYVVNMRYILEYGKDFIQMSNGDYIPISRSKKGELSAKIMDMEI